MGSANLMTQIKGYISDIIYRNEANSYTVFEVDAEGKKITCTGFPPAIHQGESCTVTGDFTEHPVYGRQFKAASYTVTRPENRQAVYRYLSSGAIKGIGEKLAKRVLEKFGDQTMHILEEEPERLAEVKGISKRVAREVAAQMEADKDRRDAMIFLQQYAISGQQAIRIFDTYGMNMYTVLRTNPYQLAEDIDGIGFVRADEIAARIGIQADDDFRIRSGLLYVLNRALQDGSTYLPRKILVDRTAQLLKVREDATQFQLDNLAMDQKVRIIVQAPLLPQEENNRQPVVFSPDSAMRTSGSASSVEPEVQVYTSSAFFSEQRIAARLLALNQAATDAPDEESILAEVAKIEDEEGLVLDDLQRQAAVCAARGGILIITGGPGTGKTTTISTIIHYFVRTSRAVALAAPTGRAAKRMAETTGYEATTIHRLLGYQAAGEERKEGKGAEGRPEEELWRFERDADNPLEADVVIIDEMSMVDLYLFDALLRAIKPGTRLVLVGDNHQLPSVGPGKVLQDLMNSSVFRTITLQKIFRQAAASDIVMNAHRLLDGEPMVMDNHSKDFFFLERSDPNVIYKHTVQLMTQMLPPYVGCTSAEIQVLTPMKKGALGSIRLNEVLQSVINPPGEGKREHVFRDTVFREGDKVMQMHNNYQLPWEVPGNFDIPLEEGTGVFNGDAGVILSIDERAQEIVVRFDENRVVHYPFQNLEDLDLSYAITVHKSQGSEYPAIILPILSGPRTLMNRNLLYTAITRAKKCVVLLGSREAIRSMAANEQENVRFTGLEARIREAAALH